MILRGLLSVLLLSWASAASAEYKAGGFASAETRFGSLHVVGDRGSQRLLFNGADLGVTNHGFEIDGVWGVEGGSEDWAVITSYHGGNMCGGFTLIALKLSAAGAVRTEEFGICQGAPIDIRVTAEGMELDVFDPAPRVAHQTFRFDGAQLVQFPVAEAQAASAGPGGDVIRWIGQHPQALTQDSSELARFATIMTPEQMDELNARLSGPGSTEQRGEWVVGSACQAHQCNLKGASWAIRISDGAAFAAFYEGKITSLIMAGNRTYSDPVIGALVRGR